MPMVESKSKLEAILKKEQGGEKPPGNSTDLKSTLEAELEGEDNELAKELQRSRAEEIIARRRVTIERMRTGQGSADTGGVKSTERGKEWLTDVAQGLLERGLDPSVVGRTIDYLLGNGQAPMVGLPGAPAPAQGMTFTDMKEIFKMGQEANRSDPNITVILSKLTDKIQVLEEKVSAPPQRNSIWVVKPDGTAEEVEPGKPIVIQPPPPPAAAANTGDSIEVVRERNRHDEKLEEIKIDKEHKQAIADTLRSIPDALAGGLADYAASRQGGGLPATRPVPKTAEAAQSGQQYYNCTECHTPIPIKPGEHEIACPKCKTVFTETPDKKES